jgi:uncharacterized membrane protein YphA (DoxX/SURF4 family)
MDIAGIVASVLLALVAAASGAPKIASTHQTRDEATHLGIPRTGYVVIGALEIAAAIGLLVGLARPLLGIAAAGGLVLMMAGAVLTHLRAGDRTAAMAPALAVGATAALTLTLRLATT